MLAIESGNLAEWVGSIGTVLAFMAAATAFAYNMYATRREATQAQAIQFDAWLKSVEFKDADAWSKYREDQYSTNPPSLDSMRLPLQVTIEWTNGSIQAIRTKNVTLYFDGQEIYNRDEMHVIPPADRPRPETRPFVCWPYGEALSRLVNSYGVDYRADAPVMTIDHFRFDFEVTFMDAAGHVWNRSGTGKLGLVDAS